MRRCSTAIAILGGSLERFATEIRNLQHTEIGEVQEPFRAGQKGSSAMPHKRNPILSERIAGLARLLRGYAHTALEDQPLWHERDISHSSAERVILPDATIVLDYMLVRMTGLVDGLIVRSERMRENIARGLGLHASSRVLRRARRRRRPVARGGLRRSSSARRCAPPTSVRRCATCSRSTRASPSGCRSPSSTRASTRRRSCATCPRSSTRLDGLVGGLAARTAAAKAMADAALSRSCAPARSATCIGSTTAGCCWSPRIGSRAFDVVLPSTIPDKGRVLTGLSRFWFAETAGIVANHLLDTAPRSWPRRSGRATERPAVRRPTSVRSTTCAVG